MAIVTKVYDDDITQRGVILSGIVWEKLLLSKDLFTSWIFPYLALKGHHSKEDPVTLWGFLHL
jgi:Neuraminidase (sialidase)